MQAPEQKRRGRPALPPGQRQTERIEIRCTKAQREKLDRLGGPQWLRDRIDKAKET
jgi:hypothetical protein